MKRKVASRKYLVGIHHGHVRAAVGSREDLSRADLARAERAKPQVSQIHPVNREAGRCGQARRWLPARTERGSDALSALLSRSSCFHFALHDSLRDTRPTSEEIERHIDACVTFFLAAHHVNRPD